ncbi:2Fe-2S iron-sulfur cluster-binding protein [Flagellatimonas centrodinii]|uniref:2Fe-2S iron-sulfur cluster-binding protein n=1 Tax=Flagellatimonas centrodinii TaxID=2806210 RepID=UPI001FF04A3C|nr:2Fe-2S iron-sulfur cluster-binding protein [Flagellatimonas centrodinii]ULQ47239.1 2Fe-2S iron-sulfur cluster-binding protein [Flagellatimonas centrodinii]
MPSSSSDTPPSHLVSFCYVDSDGVSHPVEGRVGETLMSVATQHLIAGIGGDCGGCCACGTCQVRITGVDLGGLPPATASEQDLLAFASDTITPSTRLGCQVVLGPLLAGAVVQVDTSG